MAFASSTVAGRLAAASVSFAERTRQKRLAETIALNYSTGQCRIFAVLAWTQQDFLFCSISSVPREPCRYPVQRQV